MSLPVIGNTSHNSNASQTVTLSDSHTINSGSNRLLFVSVTVFGLGNTITGVTFGGTSLAQKDSVSQASGVTMYTFFLLMPTVQTANIVATANNASFMAITASDWTNVDQTTPLGTSAHNSGSGTSSTNTVTTTSATNQVVLDTVQNAGGAALTPGSSQTIDVQETANSNSQDLGHITATGSNMTLTYSWTGSFAWTQLSVPLNGIAAVDSLSVSPTSINVGGSSNTNVQLTNTGTFTDNITASIVGASSWLSVRPTTFNGLGAGNSTNFKISTNQAFLVPGTYTDSVKFTSSNGATVTVPVTMVIPAIVGSIAWSGGSGAQTVNQGLGIIIGTG